MSDDTLVKDLPEVEKQQILKEFNKLKLSGQPMTMTGTEIKSLITQTKEPDVTAVSSPKDLPTQVVKAVETKVQERKEVITTVVKDTVVLPKCPRCYTSVPLKKKKCPECNLQIRS